MSHILLLNGVELAGASLFWACVIALVGICAYSLGNYYLLQHDKLAQLPENTFVGLTDRVEQHTMVSADQRRWRDGRARIAYTESSQPRSAVANFGNSESRMKENDTRWR